MNKVDLSIVIPIYNEQESLLELYNQIQEALNHQFIYEIIFINDGSTDGSTEWIAELCLQNKNFKMIQFYRNYGRIYTRLQDQFPPNGGGELAAPKVNVFSLLC